MEFCYTILIFLCLCAEKPSRGGFDVKQKFGTRLTSLLLCLALVAGLLQGLPVAAKAADNHNSIGFGATWFWGETINLGSGVRLKHCGAA